MKILHLVKSDLDGGAARAAYRIHKGLRAASIHSSMLVGLKFSDDPTVIGPKTLLEKAWGRISAHVDQLPMKFFRPSNSLLHSPAWIGSKVVQRVKPINPDLIHLHWICGGFLKPEDIPKLNKPLVWRLASMWPFTGAEHYTGESLRYQVGYHSNNRPQDESGIDLNRWVWNRKLKAWRKIKDLTIVTPSHWMANCARQSYLLRDRRIEVIPTGQNTRIFRPLGKKFAREILGLPQDKRLILFGAMNATTDLRKGFSLLKEALLELSSQGLGNTCELVILGSSEPKDPPHLGFKANYMGRLHDEISLALVYAAADVFVAPSTEENLANTVIEAMACGVPGVAFTIGGMPDIIKHTVNGYLAKPFETSDLAHGIQWVLKDLLEKAPSDSNRWEKLSSAARALVETEFSMDIQASRYIKLYEDILSQRN